jgi:hypothetical protein
MRNDSERTPTGIAQFPTVRSLRDALKRMSTDPGFADRCPSASGSAWQALLAACAPGGDASQIDPDYVNDLLHEAAEPVLTVGCDVDSPVGSGAISVERLAGQYWHSADDFGEIRGPFDTLEEAMDAFDFGSGLPDPDISADDGIPFDRLIAFALSIMDLDNSAECTINEVRHQAVKVDGEWALQPLED